MDSSFYLDRYKHIETVADKRGRLIGVGRLKVSQKLKISGMTEDLAGTDRLKTPDGGYIDVPLRARPMLAAMVRTITVNGNPQPLPFPRNRAELDATVDLLDEDGLAAVLEANAKLLEADGDLGGDDRAAELAADPTFGAP